MASGTSSFPLLGTVVAAVAVLEADAALASATVLSALVVVVGGTGGSAVAAAAPEADAASLLDSTAPKRCTAVMQHRMQLCMCGHV